MTRSPQAAIAESLALTGSIYAADEMAEEVLKVLGAAGYSVLPAAEPALDAGEITEHGTLFKSGDMQIRTREALVEEIYPFAQWLAHALFQGSHVYQRKVVITEDWQRVLVRDLRGEERREYDEYRARMLAMRKERSGG